MSLCWQAYDPVRWHTATGAMAMQSPLRLSYSIPDATPDASSSLSSPSWSLTVFVVVVSSSSMSFLLLLPLLIAMGQAPVTCCSHRIPCLHTLWYGGAASSPDSGRGRLRAPFSEVQTAKKSLRQKNTKNDKKKCQIWATGTQIGSWTKKKLAD